MSRLNRIHRALVIATLLSCFPVTLMADHLGDAWEYDGFAGWKVRWTRTGGQSFNVLWTRGSEQIQRVVEVTLEGRAVLAKEWNANSVKGAPVCVYSGLISPNGADFAGVGFCHSGNITPWIWRARITGGLAFGGSGPPNQNSVDRARIETIGGSIRVGRGSAWTDANAGMLLRDGDIVIVRGTAKLTWLAGGVIGLNNPQGNSTFTIGGALPPGAGPPPPGGFISSITGFLTFVIPPGSPQPPAKYRFQAATATMVVGVKGTKLGVGHDQQSHVSTVIVEDGQVDVTPANRSLKPATVLSHEILQIENDVEHLGKDLKCLLGEPGNPFGSGMGGGPSCYSQDPFQPGFGAMGGSGGFSGMGGPAGNPFGSGWPPDNPQPWTVTNAGQGKDTIDLGNYTLDLNKSNMQWTLTNKQTGAVTQISGDPHLLTADGKAYDFQAVGEFTVLKSTVDSFEVQSRQQPWGSSKTVSVIIAAAVNAAGDRVGVYLGANPPLHINGRPATLPDGITNLPRGGRINKSQNQYVIALPDSTAVKIDLNSTYLNLYIYLPLERRGQLAGLLGNYDSNPNNDLVTRQGKNVGALNLNGQQLFDVFYHEYANSWRIRQTDSLFDYGPGQNTNTFTDLIFPGTRVAPLNDSAKRAAEAACRNAGVTQEPFLTACIVDVGETGDHRFANPTVQTHVNVTPASSFPTLSNGYHVDNCLHWASQCGKPAADEYCKLTGHPGGSTNFNTAPMHPTWVIGDNRVCDESMCVGFTGIQCANK